VEERARFGEVAGKAGHYESFYLKACRPGGGLGIWIRHTVHKRPGQEPTGSIWFTLFDRDATGPTATKVTVPASELSVPTGSWIRVAEAEIGPGEARGSVGPGEVVGSADLAALVATWSLRFSGATDPCYYLPADWLYEAPLPRTKFVAPVPDAVFEGTLEVAGRSIEISGWPGMIGHNWGTEHAERWVWLEGTGFAEAAGTWFDAGAARVRLGRRVSPWVPSGMLALDGVRHRLGGLGAMRSSSIEESADGCSFVLPGKDIVVRGRAAAPRKDFVGWVYADPTGDQHHTINCSVADLELTVERPGVPDRQLTLRGGGAYELGMREKDHGIQIQPFADG
jgi:hypothetical protein